MGKTNKPHASRTDKLCGLALLGILILMTVWYEATDGAAIRAAEAAEADKPTVVITIAPDIDLSTLVWGEESIMEARREAFYWRDVPLDQKCKAALREACETNNIPICDALGVIEVESNFDPGATNGVCYGLMQLHAGYFPANLTPEDNIRAGVAYLGELLRKYDGDMAAALRAYNNGWDDGDRAYSRAVLDASEKYGEG